MSTGSVPGSNHTCSNVTRPHTRGSHIGSFEAAHRLRDGAPFDLSGVAVQEHYDLVVVGGGISGLAAAYYYRVRRPSASVLILDTNDDFGGHAKRNEFEVDGRTIIGYGGTQSIDSPRYKWDGVAKALLKDLGIDVHRFETAFDAGFYTRWGLSHAIFFKKEAFGVDRVVPRRFGTWNDWDENPADEASLRAYLAQMPLGEAARAQLLEMFWSDRDVLPGRTRAQRREILEHTSYRDFLQRYWHAEADVLKFLQTRTHDLWAIGIDAVPASETMSLPGMRAQRAALAEFHRRGGTQRRRRGCDRVRDRRQGIPGREHRLRACLLPGDDAVYRAGNRRRAARRPA